MPLRPQRRASLAFTLTEILVVVTIIGIAGAMVIPQMLDPGTMNSQAAARIIISDILFAQNDAIASQQARSVVFDPDTASYRIADAGGTTITASWLSGTAANYVTDFANDGRFNGVSIENVDFNGTTTIGFDVLGTPTTGGNLEVVSGNTRYTIAVAPFTGRVTVAPTVVVEEE